jgi:hypothetical protein
LDELAGPQAGERRPRRRRVSPTRRFFLRAIEAQITGTRLLAAVVLVVLVGGAAYWLIGTTGSPVLGLYFLALAGVLLFAVYWFVQVMRLFTGRR